MTAKVLEIAANLAFPFRSAAAKRRVLHGLFGKRSEQMQGKKVSCPCCKNGRLFDVVWEYQPGQGEIDIKCPVCKNVIRITFNKRKIRTEQIDA